MFQHLFYPDAIARFADHPAIVAAVEREQFRDTPVSIDGRSAADPRLDLFLDVLFASDDKPFVARAEGRAPSVVSLLRDLVGANDRPRA
jgi:hypothetical protein